MSPLTKAFVVLTTLLSIVMVSMTVAHVARTEDYRAKYAVMEVDRDAALKRAAAAETAEANRQAEGQEVASTIESVRSDVAGQLAALQGQIRSKDESIASLQANLARATSAQDAISSTLASATTRIDNQNDQITSLIGDLSAVSRQKAEAEQALVNAIAARNRYENEVRLLNERLRAMETALGEYQTENERLVKLIEEFGGNPDDIPADSIRIAGSVTNVDQIGDGLTLVEVNVGTRDGVRAGMPFTVYRGDQYLGTIRITTVDTDKAVGEVTLNTAAIRSNDSVKTGD
ncbi:MAG: hypothetical protein ACIAXF_15745 [Phycisphaerales bacterium JB063]